MIKKNKGFFEGVKFPSIDKYFIYNIIGVLFLATIIIGGPILIISTRYDTTHEKASEIKAGDSKEEMFDILGEIGWSNYDGESYEYLYYFESPSGREKWLSVKIKNDTVIRVYTK